MKTETVLWGEMKIRLEKYSQVGKEENQEVA